MSSLPTAETFHTQSIDSDGYAIVEDLFAAQCDEILALLKELPVSQKVRQREGVYGVRDLLGIVPDLKPVLISDKILGLVEPILGNAPFAVRSIYFDKPNDANWMVPWHQDLTIAVNGKSDAPGFGPWSVKAGVVHVQPPAEILENMVTVRVHLDDCTAENGALEVLPGTHVKGRLSSDEINRLRGSIPPQVCEVKRGGCLIMRPLLLHSSQKSTNEKHRRVIHIEFAACDLPNGMNWFERSDF
ncbi:MAG: phytanoyl-CoA dioxygenase family protein [Candidatus Hydrogenedentes bacterium]|nr:phytanoyl-CoA dioxygenase family protein [Candidatus Hydrogenedentota bacterium]